MKRRVGAMKNLQLEGKALESQFYIDLLKIDSKYWSNHREPLYQQRSDVIAPNDGETGIPDFWMRAMLQSDVLKDIIQTYDIPLIKQYYKSNYISKST